MDMPRNLFKCGGRVLKGSARPYGIKPCGFDLPDALAGDARTVPDGFKGLAGRVRAKTETTGKHFARAWRRGGEKPLHERSAVERETGSLGTLCHVV